jgi:hypothetical protein
MPEAREKFCVEPQSLGARLRPLDVAEAVTLHAAGVLRNSVVRGCALLGNLCNGRPAAYLFKTISYRFIV